MRGVAKGVAAGLGLAAATLLAGSPATAHPHIWVETRAALLFDGDGRVSGVRHRWTFDSGYSAFATQGMVSDGRLLPDKAAELARLNTATLAESGFFTSLRAGGAKQAFAESRDADVTLDEKGALVLSFTLPLKAPVATKRVLFDVNDPSFFVDFSVAPGEAVTLAGAPAGCTVAIQRPKPPAADGQPLAEAMFEALGNAASYGAQFTGRATVTCP